MRVLLLVGSLVCSAGAAASSWGVALDRSAANAIGLLGVSLVLLAAAMLPRV